MWILQGLSCLLKFVRPVKTLTFSQNQPGLKSRFTRTKWSKGKEKLHTSKVQPHGQTRSNGRVQVESKVFRWFNRLFQHHKKRKCQRPDNLILFCLLPKGLSWWTDPHLHSDVSDVPSCCQTAAVIPAVYDPEVFWEHLRPLKNFTGCWRPCSLLTVEIMQPATVLMNQGLHQDPFCGLAGPYFR